MADYSIDNIAAALAQRLFPSVTMWNRLEGRPRTVNFERALRAEVRDPLWFLSRQWQLGEFRGDDAGSPVSMRLYGETTRLRKLVLGDGAPEAFDDDLPLETRVERRQVPFFIAGRPISLDLRLAMGRQWLRLISGIGSYADAFRSAYPLALPDEHVAADATTCAHREAWQMTAAVAGRCMDGGALFLYLSGPAGRHPWDELAVTVAAAHEPLLDDAARRFLAWFRRVFEQPSGDAWDPSRLEYRFSCAAPQGAGDKVLVADGYHHGHFDWYSLDVDRASPGLGATAGSNLATASGTVDVTTMPAPLVWGGMPNTRWWAFEDRKTNFGDVRPDTTDIAKLLLIEFSLVYANDWFVLPITLPLGSITTVRGVVVTNTFGERFWIDRAGAGADTAWQRWSMYGMSSAGSTAAISDDSLALLPVAPHGLEGEPVEEVFLRRDEVANMVWGVETTISLNTGKPTSGHEAAVELRAHLQRLLDAATGPRPPADPKAPARYDVMSGVPENWIPFIPVHVPGSIREIQLQRAAMPRLLEGSTDRPKVTPRTTLMRTGLDPNPPSPPQRWFVHEEEVPRSGARLTKAYQRVRWTDGRAIVWLGVRKSLGSGETHSGLAFDRLVTHP